MPIGGYRFRRSFGKVRSRFRGALQKNFPFYVISGRVLDLFRKFTSSDTTIPDISGEGNDATLYTGRFLSTDGVADRGIVADCSAEGAGTYYLTGKVKPTAVTVARMTIDGSTSSTVTGLTANVWQDFQTATTGSITPSSVVVGWDGTTASAGDWSDVRLVNSATGATVAHWQLNDSADSNLGGYPALDSSGNGYHGAHTGCAGGTGETTILQTAGMDWNRDTTTYVGKTILVPERDALDGFDALGNAIAEPRVNSSQLNLFGDGEHASAADADSLDLTTAATWEIWGNFYKDVSVDEYILDKNGAYIIWKNDTQAAGELTFGGSGVALKMSSVPDSVACIQIVYDGGPRSFVAYVNGVSVLVTTIGGVIPASLILNANPVSVGASGAFTLPFAGKIARPKIYNRALTADEVLLNYNAQKSAFGL